MQPTALLNGESETSSITGATGGYVEITNTLNASSSLNPGNLGAILSSQAARQVHDILISIERKKVYDR